MLGHCAWFWIWGYDTGFARLPCGTYHFFLGRVSDDSFLMLRFMLAFSTLCGFVELGLIVPAFVVFFLPELARSARESEVYRGFFSA